MKRLILTLVLIANLSMLVLADEGLWMPSLLGKHTLSEMKKAGFKLSGKDIYSVNQACLTNAVLGLSHSDNPTAFFGSASFISQSGLAITNHHLILKYIQEYSTPQTNYARDGFLATSPEEELVANDLSLSRLVKIQDVTRELTEGFDKLSPGQQNNLLNQRSKELSEKHGQSGKYFVAVKSYFSGNQYFLEVYQVYKNVKLVAVPPLAIAKFGGNRDNWEWPRQAADFAVLRVYDESFTAPVKPRKHFPISRQGVNEGDFTMLLGFPGNTKMFLTSEALKQLSEITNFHSIQARSAKIRIIEQAMEADEQVWIKYADTHAGSSNHLLRWEAENAGIKAMNLVERKKVFENEFPANLDRPTAEEYNRVLSAINTIVSQLDTLEMVNAYLMEAGIQGSEITPFVALFDKLGAMATRYTDRVTQAELNRETNRLRGRTISFFEDVDFDLEKEILKEMIKRYDKNVSEEFKTKAVREAIAAHNKNYSAYIDSIFSQSIFQSEKSVISFLDHFTLKDGARLEKDPVFQLCLGFYLVNRDKVFPLRNQLRNEYARLHKQYVSIITQNAPGEVFPDANRTLRLSFGNAKGYTLQGQSFGHSTNLGQLLEKFNTGNLDYNLPGDFAQQVQALENPEEIHTCFINNSHTTGGNSGSPVLNAHGNLIGIGFDRVRHGLVSDFEYFPDYSRNIAVDIRYVLFILENYMEAHQLVNEFSFEKKRKRFAPFRFFKGLL